MKDTTQWITCPKCSGLHPNNEFQLQQNQTTDYSDGWPTRPFNATAIQYTKHEPRYFITYAQDSTIISYYIIQFMNLRI